MTTATTASEPSATAGLAVPREFKDGFGWTTVLGVFFCGLVMMPGGIYLGLMTGASVGSAASWVTVILFMEIARRALRPLPRQNLIVLLHAATVMMTSNLLFPGGPFGQLVFRAYLVTSDVVRDAGMSGAFPKWFVPAPDSTAILARNLFHPDWLAPVLVLLFVSTMFVVQRYTLGYFFFRLTSDVEKLPFPLAPVSALGATALSEAEEPAGAPPALLAAGATAPKKPKSERWRMFTLGTTLGLTFGGVLVGIPALTGLFFAEPLYPIPQPFLDTTTWTEGLLPSTPTGATLDIAVLMMGAVLPLWTVVGTFVAILVTSIANPALHEAGVLHSWQPGMDTVNTVFSNNVDFWMSFGIGGGLGVAAVSLFSTLRELRRQLRARPRGSVPGKSLWDPPVANRGDYPLWLALTLYFVTAALVVGLCLWLLPRTSGTVFFFLFFAFVYQPFIAYVNARLLGVSGQTVDIPFVRESAILVSGAKGVDIWLAPVPIDTNSWQAQSYRVNELTGVSFWSLVKTELVVAPVLFTLSFLFWAFIWRADGVPSVAFPWAEANWELYAKNQTLLYSATFVPPGEAGSAVDSEFMRAIHPSVIVGAFFGSVGLFTATALVGIPAAFYYGVFRGLGQLPHTMMLELAGALLVRYWLNRRFGKERVAQALPVVFAGYLTGVGLIGMATIALRLIKGAVSAAPF
jgi:hypothetical protein